MTKQPKRPRDFSQAAKLVIDMATGSIDPDAAPPPASPEQEFARKGGLKGGKARADALSPEKRRAIAQNAARRRWGSKS